MRAQHALATVTVVVAAALVAAGCGSNTKEVTGQSATAAASNGGTGTALNGAGSTFQEPLVVKWSGDYAKTKGAGTVNYQGVGSGAGIEQFTKKTVDFGGTDAPMKDEEIAAAQAAGGDVLHIPIALGAVVATYNLEGIDDLKLDGPTLADIYEGKVKRWNDKEIADLNKGVDLPSTDIAVVHRTEESGTTFVFTGYLSAVDKNWADGPGQSKAPKWPVGTGGQGNDGVAAAVQQQKGAIGYTEISYALQNNLSFAQLKNEAGEFVKASLESTTAAGEGFDYPDDLRFSLLNSKTKGAYPIVSATWQLVWADGSKAGQDAAKVKEIKNWLTWELTEGQAEAAGLDYAPLPKDLLAKATAAVDSVQGD
ncbi:MAG: phosphate ABC transporter substrate-binding protein PstS [Thermoleophilia bacterium]|nr:phosphate ABC transporter substrate-binding protein PstS [Thermoleophilia bacterium]